MLTVCLVILVIGVVKAKEYEEEQKHKEEMEKALGPHHHHEGRDLPPAPASNDDVEKATKIKDEANRHFIAKEYDQALELYAQVGPPPAPSPLVTPSFPLL